MDVESLETLKAAVDHLKDAVITEVLPRAQTLIDQSMAKLAGQAATLIDKTFNRAEALVEATINKISGLTVTAVVAQKKVGQA